jgi:GNAT superfamily N-acetyltransferase
VQNARDAVERTIHVRPALQADIPRLADLLDELFSVETDFTPHRERQERGLGILVGRQPGMSLVLVAEVSGIVVGMATVQLLISTAEGGRVGLVEDVVVDRRHRGKGIGRRLLSGIADWARTRDVTRLQLLADRGNSAALRFYHAAGWTPTSLVCLRQSLRSSAVS